MSVPRFFRLHLSRHGAASPYGNDISQIAVDVEFQTKDRVRFKVSRRKENPTSGINDGMAASHKGEGYE